MKVKYRTWYKAIPPRPIKLQIPGWAGERNNHTHGDKPQPWHCVPFIEGSTYGLELIYPFDAETRVVNNNGKITFESDFGSECVWSDPPTPPFLSFAPNHYGFTSSLDIEAPENHVVRIEPHPKFFTDTTGTTPIAVPGHIHPWWTKIFFLAFKSPLNGQVHIFRKDEPYAQILIVPQKINYEIELMSKEEINKRVLIEEKITKYSDKLSKNIWDDHLGQRFNDKYKCLLSIANKQGVDGVHKHIEELAEKFTVKRKSKLIGKYVKKNKNI